MTWFVLRRTYICFLFWPRRIKDTQNLQSLMRWSRGLGTAFSNCICRTESYITPLMHLFPWHLPLLWQGRVRIFWRALFLTGFLPCRVFEITAFITANSKFSNSKLEMPPIVLQLGMPGHFSLVGTSLHRSSLSKPWSQPPQSWPIPLPIGTSMSPGPVLMSLGTASASTSSIYRRPHDTKEEKNSFIRKTTNCENVH